MTGQALRQMSLWEVDDSRTASAVAGLTTAVRAAMAAAADRSPMSREQILDRVNAISRAAGVRLTRGNGKGISLDTLCKWLAPAEKDHVPSLLAVNVFCVAVGDASPIAAMLGLHGLEAMTVDDKKFRDYGMAVIHERKAKASKRKIEEDLL